MRREQLVGPVPRFGGGLSRRAQPCTPRELYCALAGDHEGNAHFLEPAYRFCLAAVTSEDLWCVEASDPVAFIDAMLGRAMADRTAPPAGPIASSWAIRVAVEFAPCGLVDGAWLRGAVQGNVIETETSMCLLRQFMIRFGDPGSAESYVERYESLLRSIGVPPASVARWDWHESVRCTDISYEHALLGLTLGFFPQTFEPETLGFNLWMSVVGPAPLLETATAMISPGSLCADYLRMHDRVAMAASARQAIDLFASASWSPEARRRVASGFAAAHLSYKRWEKAMLGANIPVTPRQFVLDAIRRKARFGADHHGDVVIGRNNVRDLLKAGPEGHEQLLNELAGSRLVRAGEPSASPLLTRSLSFGGAMFDAFTAAEKRDLREWIESLGAPAESSPAQPRVELAGNYVAPLEPLLFAARSRRRYRRLSQVNVAFCLANSDLYPGIRARATSIADAFLGTWTKALNGRAPRRAPPYSEQAVGSMVAELHGRNVESRNGPAPQPAENKPDLFYIFDACWLQGFADVTRANLEEVGWLFRIYASEHGDGILAQDHCFIFRQANADLGPMIMLPKTDARLYGLCCLGFVSLVLMAMSLHTRRYAPEILGWNLAIEAFGVAGSFMESWKKAERRGEKWKALAWKLHNSIDNYATGHTKWSLDAVNAYMRRVREVAPDDMEKYWTRIWRLWTFMETATYGSTDERRAVGEAVQLAASIAFPGVAKPNVRPKERSRDAATLRSPAPVATA